jgi:gliding motility-associated-like protein
LSDGAVDLSASGGTPPYQYSGDGSNYQSSPTLNGFAAGAHTLYVQDANGCQTTVQATVDEPAPLSINIANTDSVSCNGGSDGAVTVNATGGTQAYTFTRDGNNYQSSPNFSGLTAGNYSITVEDANGCSTVASTTVHEPSQLSGQTSATDVSCSGGNDGSASVTANGGNGNYSYTWSGGQSGSSISNLTQGTYQVTVSDGQGCSLTDSVTVDGPPPITIQPTVTDLTCNGSSDGAVDLTVNGGTPGYNYAWSTSANGPDITNLNAGNFSATVTDMQGCEDSISVVVTEPATLQFNAGKTDVQCNGQNNGKLYGSASGGTSPYSYSIDGSNYQSADTFSNLSAGSYTLYARDSNGCSTTKSLTIEEPPALEAQPANLQDPTCYGGDDGYASVIPSGGTPGYNYQWSNSSGSDSTAQNLSAGTYTVTVEDQNGCSVSLTIPINQPEQFAVKTEPAVDAKIRLGEETELKALPDPEQSNLTYEWSPSAGLSCQDCSNPTASPTTTTNYTVTARNQKGCTDSSRVVVRLEDNKLVRAPNAFTPDGDGLNDEFTPNTPGAKDIKFMIFNRWGEKVYETQQLGEGWNGKYKGEQCRPGTYVYYIKTTYDDGDQEEKEGSVTLIR